MLSTQYAQKLPLAALLLPFISIQQVNWNFPCLNSSVKNSEFKVDQYNQFSSFAGIIAQRPSNSFELWIIYSAQVSNNSKADPRFTEIATRIAANLHKSISIGAAIREMVLEERCRGASRDACLDRCLQGWMP